MNNTGIFFTAPTGVGPDRIAKTLAKRELASPRGGVLPGAKNGWS